MSDQDVVLELDDVAVHLDTDAGEVQATRAVSFTIGQGEMVGLVGESGSGKSLTALAVMGLLPDGLSRVTGRIRLAGRDLVGLSGPEMAKVRGRDVSMIFQEALTALDPVFRVGDQIAETVRAHRKISRREADERAIELLGAVGIPDPETRARAYPHQLSGGMRQRVMIAIALVSEPKLLIADEPTTALDVTIQAQILSLLRSLSEDRGMAILLITHDLGVVAETCARVNTMYAGEIVEQRATDPLMIRPRHPYTSGLMASIPRVEDRRRYLYTIPGRVPTLQAMPDGCRFRERCDHAAVGCEQEQDLRPDDGGAVRCRRADDLVLAGSVPSGQEPVG
ncbi:MAG: ABC transporter ATP-binding protein [Acidimicrobiales bacterium]